MRTSLRRQPQSCCCQNVSAGLPLHAHAKHAATAGTGLSCTVKGAKHDQPVVRLAVVGLPHFHKPAAQLSHAKNNCVQACLGVSHADAVAATHSPTSPSLTLAVPLSADELWECERRDVMFWRREGEAYEPPEDSEAEYEEEGGLVSATNME